jgi:membrane glycosyltransferase
MLQEPSIAAVAHVIQLAVAPVFLLTGIGGMLAVMTNRLGRIVDRARKVEGQPKAGPEEERILQDELLRLSRRARLISLSISLCTLTALLVSAVIAILFLGAFLAFDVSVIVALLFVAAMLAFIVALLGFLSEVFLAIDGLSFGRSS